MKTLQQIIDYRQYDFDELPEEDRLLIEAAKEATRRSYAPYSRFHVGAAIRLANDEIVTGANQENAAFSSGTCAERSACFYAAARHPGVAMKKIAIAANSRTGHPDDAPYEATFQKSPISPCGACRQALLEYENLYGDMEVLLFGLEGVYVFPSIKSLLPFCFTEF